MSNDKRSIISFAERERFEVYVEDTIGKTVPKIVLSNRWSCCRNTT